MAQNTELLDWQVALDDNAWARPQSLADLTGSLEPVVDQPAPPSLRTRLKTRLLWAVAGLVLINTVFGAYLLWRQANAGYEQIQAEIGETVELETWSAQTGNQAVAASVVDIYAPPAWRQQFAQAEPLFRGDGAEPQVTIEAVELLDDLAMVQVRLTQAGPDSAYRATRYYRRVDEQWLRTAPDPRLWGASQTLETAYFQFYFRTKEGDAVRETAARLDAVYASLRRDLGLGDVPADAPKRRIELLPEIPPRNLFYSANDDRLLVLSPLVLTMPSNVPDAEILTKAIVNLLVQETVYSTLDEHDVQRQWAVLINGFALWQAYEGSDSLHDWHADAAQWMYRDAPAIRSGQRAPSVADLNLLCRGYDVWGLTVPLDLSIPSLCTADTWSPNLKYMMPAPARLAELSLDETYDENLQRNTWAFHWLGSVAASTVIEYVVETYGRERVPVLVDAMGLYDTWDELVAEVVGLPVAEFEAGWQTYIATRYAGCTDECRAAHLLSQP